MISLSAGPGPGAGSLRQAIGHGQPSSLRGWAMAEPAAAAARPGSSASLGRCAVDEEGAPGRELGGDRYTCCSDVSAEERQPASARGYGGHGDRSGCSLAPRHCRVTKYNASRALHFDRQKSGRGRLGAKTAKDAGPQGMVPAVAAAAAAAAAAAVAASTRRSVASCRP